MLQIFICSSYPKNNRAWFQATSIFTKKNQGQKVAIASRLLLAHFKRTFFEDLGDNDIALGPHNPQGKYHEINQKEI